jgi:hypothetical protein
MGVQKIQIKGVRQNALLRAIKTLHQVAAVVGDKT